MNTWNQTIEESNRIEREFLMLLQSVYPKSYKVDGDHAEYDFFVPEKDITIELKYDIKSDETGNFAIEYEYRGKKSGIAGTEAKVWVIRDAFIYHLFKTGELKDYLRQHWHQLKKTDGGDNQSVRMILVKRSECYGCQILPDEATMLQAFLSSLS